MASISASSERRGVTGSNRGKPKIVIRGRRRKSAKKALRSLKQVFNQDFAENSRAAVRNYRAYLITGNSNSAIFGQFEAVIDRLEKSLAAKL